MKGLVLADGRGLMHDRVEPVVLVSGVVHSADGAVGLYQSVLTWKF